ncbi:putative cucumisin [Helianthus annuus]|nr:putative cucumisin [Helianthus annuus]
MPFDKNSVKFNTLSGTSMACPHVTAAAAFIKSFHPDWFPSAIKSALMTIAWEFKASLYPQAEFAYGSGHIDPVKALNPGLVYETSFQEYLKTWCNFTNANCTAKLSPKEINYPSMAVRVEVGVAVSESFPRTLTNVGARSTYVASIEGGTSKLRFKVDPNTLRFTKRNQKKIFVVTVKGSKMKASTINSASLVWTDGVHKVRSPIVVYTRNDGKRASHFSRLHIIFMLIFTCSFLF